VRLGSFGGDQAQCRMARIRLAAEFLRRDREIDLRDLELRNRIDETECGDAQLFGRLRKVAFLYMADSALQKREIEIVRSGRDRHCGEAQQDCGGGCSLDRSNHRLHRGASLLPRRVNVTR